MELNIGSIGYITAQSRWLDENRREKSNNKQMKTKEKAPAEKPAAKKRGRKPGKRGPKPRTIAEKMSEAAKLATIATAARAIVHAAETLQCTVDEVLPLTIAVAKRKANADSI